MKIFWYHLFCMSASGTELLLLFLAQCLEWLLGCSNLCFLKKAVFFVAKFYRLLAHHKDWPVQGVFWLGVRTAQLQQWSHRHTSQKLQAGSQGKAFFSFKGVWTSVLIFSITYTVESLCWLTVSSSCTTKWRMAYAFQTGRHVSCLEHVDTNYKHQSLHCLL